MDINNISIKHDGDIIFVTAAKYKLFLSYGKIGMDAYVLYSHLIYLHKSQQTQSIEITTKKILQDLKWTKMQFNKTKKILQDLNILKIEKGGIK